jgi:Abortive infection alpha
VRHLKPIDKIIDAGKEFLQKIISPPLEEVGLLFADKVKFWRLQNQLKVLLKAEDFLKANNIKTKKVSLKLLTPLLEDCSMEEDENLQEKWASLLANTIREDSKIDTTVFSYILSQITTTEAQIFDKIINRVIERADNKNGESITTFSYNQIDHRALKINKNDIFNELDNLIRLRLLKEIDPGRTGLLYQVTMLGLSFYRSCQFKD